MTYKIDGQRRSLLVDLNTESGVFLFAGVSLPENTNAFFEPVLDELNTYLQNPKDKTVINFYIEYLNTSSALYLRRIILACEDALGGDKLDVNWHYEKDDDDIRDFGIDFRDVFKHVKINLIQITENPYT
ncbi:MAG: DUF1987 domain-containing protein [Crocinitomicaceae bacterium]|nr:DUF1987 domain-containing protein [Crocinitomicaceae bacterium]